MPDYRRRNCKECGGYYTVVGPLSWRGLCAVCGPKRSDENADALHTMTGPHVARWRRGMAASVGAVLLDDVQAKP